MEEAHENISVVQDQQARQYDLKRKFEVFKVGEFVLLNRSGINYLPSASNSPILLSPYIGPFMVSAVDLTRDNYTLALPGSMRCHKTFHVRCLKRYISPIAEFPLRKVPVVPVTPGTDYYGIMVMIMIITTINKNNINGNIIEIIYTYT